MRAVKIFVWILASQLLFCNVDAFRSAGDDMNNCALYNPDQGISFIDEDFYLAIDYGKWNVQEVHIYLAGSDQMFVRAVRDFPTEIKIPRSNSPRDLDVVLVYTDGTRSCASITYALYQSQYRYTCPSNVQAKVCPFAQSQMMLPSPICSGESIDTCAVGTQARDWQCINGECIRRLNSSTTVECRDLYRRDFFIRTGFRIWPNSNVQLAFRLTDCEGAMLSTLTSDQLVVSENNLPLAQFDTKQIVVKLDHNNFVQLMISMCPRTSSVLNELIDGLNVFLDQLDLNKTHVALTVFDGANGYVDLVYYTQNEKLLRQSFQQLRNYTSRDESCNVRESVTSKLEAMSSYFFGPTWDRVYMVVFTASADFANLLTEQQVLISFSNAAFPTYMIGWDVPVAQQPMMQAIGRSGSRLVSDPSALGSAFNDIGQLVSDPWTSDYLVGYCSPSRSGTVETKISWNTGDLPIRIQGFSFDASSISGGCHDSDVLNLCPPNITASPNLVNLLATGGILCLDAFNDSSITDRWGGNAAQVLLRYAEAGAELWIKMWSWEREYPVDVYLRRGGVANPALFDYHFSVVDESSFSLNVSQYFIPGDLVGVYVEHRDSDGYTQLEISFFVPEVPESPPVAAPIAIKRPHASPVKVSAASQLFSSLFYWYLCLAIIHYYLF